MRITKALFLFGAGLFILPAMQLYTRADNDQPEALKASLARGGEVYRLHCMSCHQANGSGAPGITPPLSRTSYTLGDKDALIEIILNGLDEEIEINGEYYFNPMPSFDALSDQEIADALTFIRNSFGNDAGAVQPEEVMEVRRRASQ